MARHGTKKAHAEKLADDGGMTSRKLWLTVFTMVIITALGLISGLAAFTGLAANLPVVVGGVLGALGVFCGANVATKFASAGVLKGATETEPVEQGQE